MRLINKLAMNLYGPVLYRIHIYQLLLSFELVQLLSYAVYSLLQLKILFAGLEILIFDILELILHLP